MKQITERRPSIVSSIGITTSPSLITDINADESCKFIIQVN